MSVGSLGGLVGDVVAMGPICGKCAQVSVDWLVCFDFSHVKRQARVLMISRPNEDQEVVVLMPIQQRVMYVVLSDKLDTFGTLPGCHTRFCVAYSM